MDGKGRWVDNVFVERLWRSVKYEEVYLKAYDTPRQAELELDKYFHFYNEKRRHQGLDRQTHLMQFIMQAYLMKKRPHN